jgi:VWFA-related protein
MRFILIIAFAATALLCSAQQNPAPAQAPPTTLRGTSQEVLLDLVVRDKKGRLVKNVTAKDFEVTDDGELQKILSFRLVTASEGTPQAAASDSTTGGGGKPATLDPLRQVRIVTLVFDRLGTDARNTARSAVNELLKSETGPNLFFAVFSIDQRLSILQQYTTDKDLVRKAVAKVTSSASSLYTSESDRIEGELKTVAAQDAAGATPSVGPPNGGGPPLAPPSPASFATVAFARLTLDTLQFSQTMDRTLQGRSTLFALQALISQQNRLPGRKTLLFFCEGLNIPPEYVEEFQGLIGNANRANVSVYGIDARGLVTFSQNSQAGSILSEAVSASRSQQGTSDGPVTRDQVTSGDRGEEAIRSNSQNSLADLSDKTGGFMIANTNDLKGSLRRVAEDVDTHYELAYSPAIRNFDGHFRRIAVKLIDRPEIRLQTRSGYYALPFIQGQSLLTYEMPMLNALTAAPLPRDIPFRSSGLHFKSATGDPVGVVVIDVPLEGIEFTKDETNHVYQTHFSVLAMFKDAQGSIVRKFSQDVARQGPLDKLDAFKMGHFIYSQHAPLPPGRYTLETAVTDRITGKISAKKSAILIPPASQSATLSSLVRVRSVAPMDPTETAVMADRSDDPFQVAAGKVSPGLDDTAKTGPGSALSIFFTVYTQPGSQTAPDLGVEFLQDGKVIGRGNPKLSPPDSHGIIPYIASTPLESFKPGQYEMRVTISQNGKATAAERTIFTVE